jgi:hypothetical protein
VDGTVDAALGGAFNPFLQKKSELKMTLGKRDVCARLGVSSNKQYGRIVNLARYYKKHDRLADYKRIRPAEHKVLVEAGFFDEKPKLLEEDTDLVVLTSNIAFKFAGQTSEGDGLTLLEHARKRRHEEDLAKAQALEPEPPEPEPPEPEPPEPEPPEPEPPWSDELRVVFQNEW